MDLINKYLEKFKNIKDPKEDKIVIIKIFGGFNFSIQIDQIEIRKNTLYISNINPILKNQIFLNKKDILNQIKMELPNSGIENIF